MKYKVKSELYIEYKYDISCLMNIYEDRLQKLRTELDHQELDGFIVPHADEYQGEYVAPYAERLSYITGFTGSAGLSIILPEKACIFSDGRYTIQLSKQVDPLLFETYNIRDTKPENWLVDNIKEKQIIGYDPFLHSPDEIKRFEQKGLDLRAVIHNPIDSIWKEKPSRPQSRCEAFPEDIAGKSSLEKRQQIAKKLNRNGVDAIILTLPDSICWLLNVRGHDVKHLPVLLSYAILYTKNGCVDWFINKEKIEINLSTDISIKPPETLEQILKGLKGRVQIDSRTAPIWFKQTLEKNNIKIKEAQDPCLLPKACKTPAEQNAMRTAHIRDGKPLTKFIQWIKNEGKKGRLSELDAAIKLETLRQELPEYIEPSFETISGWNENGAIIHYSVSKATNTRITPPGLLLVDSGAQYPDGTTDVTRTIAIGEPSKDMKEKYTCVLKSHIALARAQFPKGTTGAQLDTLARQPFWEVGLDDYAHGTGHGVGCYLSVHEGPVHISPLCNEALHPGMILSNEPGYYKEGEYGIRIENLILVIETGEKTPEGKDLYAFETLTMAPMDNDLIIRDRLSKEELNWLDKYHEKVKDQCA